MTMFTTKITRDGIDTEIFVARDHVIHRFKFNGIDLKADGFPINQTVKSSFMVLSNPTKTPLPFWNNTFSKTEFTLNEEVFPSFPKPGLFKKLDFVRERKRRPNEKVQRGCKAIEDRFF